MYNTVLELLLSYKFLLPEKFSGLFLFVALGHCFYFQYLFLARERVFFSGFGLCPFMHTWSLSIEEQYYLVYPLLFLLLLKTFSNRKNNAVCLMCHCSHQSLSVHVCSQPLYWQQTSTSCPAACGSSLLVLHWFLPEIKIHR